MTRHERRRDQRRRLKDLPDVPLESLPPQIQRCILCAAQTLAIGMFEPIDEWTNIRLGGQPGKKRQVIFGACATCVDRDGLDGVSAKVQQWLEETTEAAWDRAQKGVFS